MRVWLAGLFVMGGICLALALMMDRVSIFFIVPILVALFFIICFVTLMFFSLIPEKGDMHETDP